MKTEIQIILKDERKINLTLDSDYAPKTVEHFLGLVDKMYFDGLIFHRVIKDFMIQTGGYKVVDNTLTEADPCDTVIGEFNANGIKNDLKHELGVISMARTNDKNSASGQFFLCSTTCPWLDGQYASFGYAKDEDSKKVILDISNVPTGRLGYGFDDFPYELIEIKTIIRL